MNLLPQSISTDVFLEKYAKGGETTTEQVYRRVAKGVAKAELPAQRAQWEEVFFENMQAGAIGAGRIMSAAGTAIKATLANCFVQPIGDCIQGKDANGLVGIYEALREAAETMRRGGGVGYNFSMIRPRDAFVKGTHSYASGPCSYIDVFDASCKTVESAGSRRGAQMGVLNIAHPDILEFVKAKRTPGRWNNFNVSVFVSDAFMHAKNKGSTWELTHEAEPSQKLKDAGAYQRADQAWVYSKIDANDLWSAIMQSNYDFAEPGILFDDNINNDNNLHYVEVLSATNPCGEQPLPAYGCCDLGPIILTKFVKQPFKETAWFDFEAFKKAVAIQVRFLDNVLAVTLWPLPQQKKESDNKRRIGVGFTGLGNALAMLGKKYDSDEGRASAAFITEVMRNTAYNASVDLAIERGPFPLFNAEEYLKKGTFASRLPAEIKAKIAKNGIRNSHLLSIAPTGTVSLAFADNASNGIEPPFSFAYNRKKRMADGSSQMYPVIDHSLRVYLTTLDESIATPLLEAICNYQSEFLCQEGGVTVTKQVKDCLPASMVVALEMSAEDHLSMLKVVQPFIDTSISKTVNVPGDYPFEDFKAIYDKAWAYKLKGVSTYRPNAILGSVLSVGTEVKKEAPPAEVEVLKDVNPLTLMVVKRPDNELESVTKKVPYSGPDGDNSLFVSISFAQVDGVHHGAPVTVNRPIEVFITASANGAPSEWVAAHARDLSLIARAGLPILAKALQNSREIISDKGRTRYGWYEKADGSKVPRFHGSDVACIAYALQEILIRKGLLDNEGNVFSVGQLTQTATQAPAAESEQPVERRKSLSVGKRCPECGDHTLVKKDGCEFCTSCGHTGSCG